MARSPSTLGRVIPSHPGLSTAGSLRSPFYRNRDRHNRPCHTTSSNIRARFLGYKQTPPSHVAVSCHAHGRRHSHSHTDNGTDNGTDNDADASDLAHRHPTGIAGDHCGGISLLRPKSGG